MKPLHRVWSAGIVVVAVIALLLLSMVLPSSAAAPVSAHDGAAAGSAAPASPRSSSGAGPPNAGRLAHPTLSSNPSPHPGTLDIYEITSGLNSLDPAVAYDTVSEEPILNIYQTLVTYDGSSTAQFLPQLSTCVPGGDDGSLSPASVSCEAIYGQSLVVNNGLGQPQYYTYPIDPNARFYDAATGAHWAVYPSDVMFTVARSAGFADLPCVECQAGWILSQALLPQGSFSWDSGIHQPYNNTPQHILDSMLVNDSTYCPSAALAQNGCITFDANGGGTDWPMFGEFLAQALGAGIEPCGWFTAQSAGVPGFPGTSAANGDGPCRLPGNATSTSQSGFQNYLTGTSPTGWDAFEALAYNTPSIQPGVQFAAAGSGPYYLSSVAASTGYSLEANPYYHQPTGCIGVSGCEPAASSYPATVSVTYEANASAGIAAYEAGQADSAPIDQANVSTLLAFQADGKIGVVYAPSITEGYLAYNFEINVTNERAMDPNPGQMNIPSNFFASNTVRDFLNHAWPYATVQSSVWGADGVSYGFNFGGTIPQHMGNYYPTNISWPYLGGDPVTNDTLNTSVNSAAWWWAQGTTNPGPANPYYDPELAACLNVTCQFPVINHAGNPTFSSAVSDLIASVESITGGAVEPYAFNVSFSTWVISATSMPGQNGLTAYPVGWAPDYPDPSDYMVASYLPNGTWPYSTGIYPTLTGQPQFNAGACGHTSGSFVDLVYWANYLTSVGTPIPSTCQGPAYSSMVTWTQNAAALANISYRALVYNEVEHIENQLGLFLWYEQENTVETYASWIDPVSINTNVMFGGSGAQTWFSWAYASGAPGYAVTFRETGLEAGTTWSVTLGGSTEYSNVSTVGFDEPNGNYTFSVGTESGYVATPAGGVVSVFGGSVNRTVAFDPWASGGAAIGALYTVYNSRPDLQAAFPEAPGNLVQGSELVSWAGSVVLGQTTDSAYTALAPYGYWYALMAVYNGRADLQSAFPDAYQNFTNYTLLVNWAGGVVTNSFLDSDASTLAPFGYYYDLMYVYDGRSDLQSAFPNAFTDAGSYTLLVNWAGGALTNAFFDSDSSVLAPFGYYYVLMCVYDGRADLQTAFPNAFTNWSEQQALVSWAGEVVNGTITDSANATLQYYGYWYALFGWVYENRADLQATYPTAVTCAASYQGLLAWAKAVVTGGFPDSAYSTLLPFATAYEVLG